MTEDEMIAVIDAELRRQAQDDRPDTPCLHNRLGDEQGIDGSVNLRQLARAILSAVGATRSASRNLTGSSCEPQTLEEPLLSFIANKVMELPGRTDDLLTARPPESMHVIGIELDGKTMPRLIISGDALKQVQQRVREKLGQPGP